MAQESLEFLGHPSAKGHQTRAVAPTPVPLQIHLSSVPYSRPYCTSSFLILGCTVLVVPDHVAGHRSLSSGAHGMQPGLDDFFSVDAPWRLHRENWH